MFEKWDSIEKKVDQIIRILNSERVNSGEKLHDTSSLCRALKCNPQTLRRYIHEEGLPASKLGNKFIISEKKLQEWLTSKILNNK